MGGGGEAFHSKTDFYEKKKIILRNDLKEMEKIPEGRLVMQGGMSRETGKSVNIYK